MNGGFFVVLFLDLAAKGFEEVLDESGLLDVKVVGRVSGDEGRGKPLDLDGAELQGYFVRYLHGVAHLISAALLDAQSR